MTVTFEKRKKDFLGKSDKSSIGSWDKPIVGLCDKINKSKDYFTLSSCSGRIVLLKNVAEKKHGNFLYRNHQKTSFNELKKELDKVKKKYKGSVIFKQEPCILHVACKDIVKAKALLMKAQSAGWKHSGIIAISDNRVVVELIGSEYLAFPIIELGHIIVDDEFIKILLIEANERLERTWKKINKLSKLI